MSQVPPNELRTDLLAAASVNPWPGHDSSARQAMMGSHLSQFLVIDGANLRRCQTGTEREFGRFTFNIKFPCNAEVLRVIDKYPPSHGRDAIRENPMTLVIYEDVDTKEIGVLEIPRYSCHHQHFGFKYKFKPPMHRLMVGAAFGKGTIMADSPSVDDHGNYKMGIETEVAFMSVPGVIEDGVIISEAYAQRLKTHGFETKDASWGKGGFPLNMYGTKELYKPFPDIGEKIRDDGILFAIRQYDDLLAPVEMTPEALMQTDHYRDLVVYATPGARVIDVTVRHGSISGPSPTPTGMEVQANKYYRAQLHFYQTLLETYNSTLRKRYPNGFRISPRFDALLQEALAYIGDFGKNRPKQMFQRVELDDWRVDITYEYDIVPTVGFKLTDFHGGKGVVCAVWATEDMPVDAEGNRADCIMDGDSTIKRMNIGRMYEQYINATSRHVSNQVRGILSENTPDAVDRAWQYLLGYYQIVSPRMYDLITGPSYTDSPHFHVTEVARNGVYLWMPPNNPADSPDIIEQLEQRYGIHIGPVTYRGRSGRVVTTHDPVLIGSLYVMLLEKTGGDWSGVSSAKLQHFGIPARLGKYDKHSAPGRAQPVRILGESETRLFAATMGGEATAEMLEMSNNPALHKHIVANILRAEQPTNIATVIDRSEIPIGGSRALVYVNHALETAGARFVATPDDEDPITIYPPDPANEESRP